MTDRVFPGTAALAFVCLLWTATPAASEGGGVVYHQDFRGGQFDNGSLTLVGVGAAKLVEPTPDGLVVRLPRGLGHPEPIGIAPRFLLSGDFDVVVSFEILRSDEAREGYGVGLSMLIEADTPARDALTIERLDVPDQGQTITSTHITRAPDGGPRYSPVRVPARSRGGRLRLHRLGPIVHSSYDDGTGSFEQLGEVEFGTDDVVIVRIGADTGWSDHGVEVLLEDLRIEAEGLPPPGASAPRRRPVWIYVASAGLLALPAAWALVVRRRSAG
jgi:hypothetical protein